MIGQYMQTGKDPLKTLGPEGREKGEATLNDSNSNSNISTFKFDIDPQFVNSFLPIRNSLEKQKSCTTV